MEASPHRSSTNFVLRQLVAALFDFRNRTLVALGLVILAKLAAIVVPLVLKGIVDQLSRMQTAPVEVVLPVSLVIAYALLRFLGTFFSEVRDMVFARVTRNTESRFLLRVFAHLHSLSTRFHAHGRIGGLTRDVERGTAGVGFLVGVGLFAILPTLVEIVGVIVVMSSSYNLWFTAIILLTFLVYASFTVVFTERRALYQRALNKLDSSANGRLVDSMLNHETVKYYTNEAFEHRSFAGILERWIDLGVKNQKALSTLHIGQSAIIAVGVTGVMLLATRYVAQGTMSVGDLVLVNAYVIQICLPLNALGFIFREARDAVINAERMLRLLEEMPEIRDAPNAPDLRVEQGEVRFENVNFSYDSSRQILWDVSFRIPAGATVAVVGGSGSGKSTLARLLFRFYEVEAGRITVDGVDIRDVTQRSLRQAVSIVPQDTILFNETIAYNIGYSKPEASLEEIIEAAKAASLHDFISSLPKQYDTAVGERGIMLSGGEKQRIAIARALLRNPPIMVFDEATSALDSRSERAIQNQLDKLSRTRTTLVIAHRLSSVVDADEILVLEHGHIAERGRHEGLLRKNGLYAQLWRLQRQQQEVEHSERDLALQQVELVALFTGVIDAHKPLVEQRGASLFSMLGSGAAYVMGDAGRLRQVFWTLLHGAVTATRPGDQVEVRMEREGSRIRASLRHRDRAMEPEEGMLEPRRIRDLVEQLGGAFDIHQEEEHVMVSIVLPLCRVEDEPRPAIEKPNAPAAVGVTEANPPLSGARVLLVDNNPSGGELRDDMLNRLGALPRTFSSGDAALDWLFDIPSEEWPDVLVYDLSDEDDAHYDFIRRLRHFENEADFPLADRLPAIILCSDESDENRNEERVRTMLAGFQIQLNKPVDADELVAAIASVLRAPSPSLG